MKKITLSKQTLRELTGVEAAAVAGGARDTLSQIGCPPSAGGGCETRDNPPFYCVTNQPTCTLPTN